MICSACGTIQPGLNPRQFLCNACVTSVPEDIMERYNAAAAAITRFRRQFKRHEAQCPDELLDELAAAWTEAAGIARQKMEGNT